MTWGDTHGMQLISILRRSVQSQCRIHEILVAAMPIDINKPGQIGSGILPNIQHQEPWVRSKFNDIWIHLGLLRIEEVFNIRMGLITSFDNQWGGVNFTAGLTGASWEALRPPFTLFNLGPCETSWFPGHVLNHSMSKQMQTGWQRDLGCWACLFHWVIILWDVVCICLWKVFVSIIQGTLS